MGLALLGAGTAVGSWAALNTSPVGTVAFAGSSPELARVARASARTGGLVIVGEAVGIRMLFGQAGRAAAWATGLTGVGLWAVYELLIAKSELLHAQGAITPTAQASSPLTVELVSGR